MKSLERINLFLILSSVMIGIVFYPLIPSWMASHWDIYDMPNQYVPRFLGVFVIPIVMAGLFVLFQWLPEQDPYKANIKAFRKYYDEFLFVIIAFLFYVHFVMIIWNTGLRFQIGQLIAPAFGSVLFYLGHIIRYTKPNHTLGFATPWTLKSDETWKKTHSFAGTLFQIAGAMSCLGFIFVPAAMYFVVGPFILAVIYILIYSFFVYKKLQ